MFFIFTSCGKSNLLDSRETSGFNTYGNALASFEGNYDLVKMGSNDCGSSIQIVRECDGLMLLSNHLGPEEFCNINKGEKKSINVTLVGNQLKSEMNVTDNRNGRDRENAPSNPEKRMSFINTLTLNDKILIKISNFKSRMSFCEYLKR